MSADSNVKSEGVVYRIKPLVWGVDAPDVREAICGFAVHRVWTIHGYWYWCNGGGRFERCESLEGAKARAEADYRDRMLSGLEPVTPRDAEREMLDALVLAEEALVFCAGQMNGEMTTALKAIRAALAKAHGQTK